MRPTAERVRELLDYDPLTGVFVWKRRTASCKRWNTKNAGKVAGGSHNRGYTHIAIDRVKYLAHHLAWVFMTGNWPTDRVDHKDLNKKHNAWANLRFATPLENSANASVRSDNISGFRGVSFVSKRKTWQAKITRDGKTVFLGSFPTAELASIVYAAKARELYGEYCPQYLVETAA
jgi:hypothetical protein